MSVLPLHVCAIVAEKNKLPVASLFWAFWKFPYSVSSSAVQDLVLWMDFFCLNEGKAQSSQLQASWDKRSCHLRAVLEPQYLSWLTWLALSPTWITSSSQVTEEESLPGFVGKRLPAESHDFEMLSVSLVLDFWRHLKQFKNKENDRDVKVLLKATRTAQRGPKWN